MLKSEAYRKLYLALETCTDEQATDVRTILRYGAGDMGLPPGAVLTEPEGMPAERRIAYCSLVDGIRYLGGGGDGDNAQYRECLSGAWEPVLATLVILGEWGTIAETAAGLRSDAEQREADGRVAKG